MRPTARLLAPRAHKPLIQFVGKRQWPAQREQQHAHPLAPADLRERFADFVKKFQSSSSSAPSGTSSASKGGKSGADVIEQWWTAPARLIESHVNAAEIEAIESGGASMH